MYELSGYRRLCFVALLLTFLAPAGARATLMPPLGVAELVQRADVVAVVDVAALSTVRDGPRRHIYTDYQVVIRDLWYRSNAAPRFAAADQLVLRQIGGRIGAVEQSVVGSVALVPGEQLVIFARYRGERLYLVGMGQGAYSLQAGRVRKGWTPGKAGPPRGRVCMPLERLRDMVKRFGIGQPQGKAQP